MPNHILIEEDELFDIITSDNILKRELKERRRWYYIYNIVFPYNNKLYAVFYNEPATELQEDDHNPFHAIEWDGLRKLVRVIEVEKFTKTVEDYRIKDA